MTRKHPPPGAIDSRQLLDDCCEAYRDALVDAIGTRGLRCLRRWDELPDPERHLMRHAMRQVICVMMQSIDRFHGGQDADELEYLRRRVAGKPSH